MLDFMDNNKYLMLIARILLGLVYVYFIFMPDTSTRQPKPFVPFPFQQEVVEKLDPPPPRTASRHTIESGAKKGIPAFVVYIGLAIKLFGGAAIIIGFQTRLAALGLITFTCATVTIWHLPNGPATFYVVFFKELCMIGGLLALAVIGPGELSVDGSKKVPKVA